MDRTKQREIAIIVRPEAYASTSVDSKAIARDDLQSDIDKFLAAGGKIEKVGIIINTPERKKSQEQVRSDFREKMLKERKMVDEKKRGKDGDNTT
jgi:hypothetical protein